MESKDAKMVAIAVLVKNLITIALFVLLAVMFEKWWICLFAVLFMTGYTSEKEKKEKTEEG